MADEAVGTNSAPSGAVQGPGDGWEPVAAVQDARTGDVEPEDEPERPGGCGYPVCLRGGVGGFTVTDNDGEGTVLGVLDAAGAVPDGVPVDGVGDQVVPASRPASGRTSAVLPSYRAQINASGRRSRSWSSCAGTGFTPESVIR
jgi:hypothetical protein